jgi:uncharacterized membrane-anchored protein YitT (DUF2179 family)
VQKRIRSLVLDVGLILLGGLAFALGFAIFLEPYQINGGGVAGLAMVFCTLTNFSSTGTVTMVVNIPLFIIGYRRLGKRFFFGSLIGTISSSVLLDLFLLYLPTVTTEPLLAALYGGVLVGFGCGLMLSRNGSSGGVDIMVRLLKQKFRNMSAGKLMIAIDIVIIAITGIAFRDLNKALYSMVTLYVSSIVLDGVVYGFDYSKVAFIVSDHYQEVARALITKLSRGVTLLQGEGAYTGAEKRVILCAIKRQQMAELKEIVTEIDPNAFIILQEAHQILGDGFEHYSKNAL